MASTSQTPDKSPSVQFAPRGINVLEHRMSGSCSVSLTNVRMAVPLWTLRVQSPTWLCSPRSQRGETWKRLVSRGMNRSKSTIRTFLKAYAKQGKLRPRRGSPAALPTATHIVDAAVDKLEANRRLGLWRQTFVLALTDAPRMNRTLLWKLRHDRGHHFHKGILACDFTKAQIANLGSPFSGRCGVVVIIYFGGQKSFI
jgi:hypothetical protein